MGGVDVKSRQEAGQKQTCRDAEDDFDLLITAPRWQVWKKNLAYKSYHKRPDFVVAVLILASPSSAEAQMRPVAQDRGSVKTIPSKNDSLARNNF